MTKVMTPSEVKIATTKQIDKAVANYRAMLEGHADAFPSKEFQMVLGQSEFARAQFELLRTRVEAMSKIIIRRVKVDRGRTPQEVVDATGRKQYIDKNVLATMPQGEGDEVVDVWFIPTKRRVPILEVPAFLAQYGLVPDPRAQAAVNEEDPAFADSHPNGSQWGDYCYLMFDRWHGGRCVYVHRYVVEVDWYDEWFLSGVPAPRK